MGGSNYPLDNYRCTNCSAAIFSRGNWGNYSGGQFSGEQLPRRAIFLEPTYSEIKKVLLTVEVSFFAEANKKHKFVTHSNSAT